MLAYLARRISLILITLLVVSMSNFLFTEVLPCDVAKMMLKQTATEESLARVREELDLNRPAWERYGGWIWGVVRGDFGNSYVMREPIADILPRRIYHSLMLALFALVVGIPAAVAAGVWAGIRPDRLGDRMVSVISLVGISLPEFVTGVILMLVLSSTLHLLPPSSVMLPGDSPLTRPQILIMPTLTLMAVLFGYIMRMTRANVIEVMQTPYVRTAILKGLPMRIAVRT